MIQLRLPIPLPEPRQPLNMRQLWARFDASVAANEFQPVGTNDGSTAMPHAVRNHTGSGSVTLIKSVTALFFVLLVIGCSEAESGTVADYWGLNVTPTVTTEPTSMPTATPTTAPAPTLAPTVTPAPVVVDDVETQVSADGKQYQIVQGDNLWRIARAALRNSGATWNNSAVGQYVTRIIADNPDTQHNPDLIYPNQVVMLPKVHP